MRTLNNPQTHAQRDHHDQGAVLVMVALVMTVLLGVGALTVDLGALYAEKRELQNGSDAAALAVAQDCSLGTCAGTVAGGSATATAVKYADLNARDGTSTVDFVCGSAPGATPGLPACADPAPTNITGAAGWVRVRTSTRQSNGSASVPFVLGPVMNSVTSKTVHATTTVAWGSLGSFNAAPLIFSLCEYMNFGGSINPMTFPSGQRTITFHGVGGTNEAGIETCHTSPSGQDPGLPGGFGYVENTNCIAALIAGGLISPEQGNSFPKGCEPDIWLNNDIVISIFDQEINGHYHVAGFVGFRLLGYHFNGSNTGPSGFKCKDDDGHPYNNNVVCVYGEFNRFSTDGGGWGGTDLGARVIKVVG